MADRVVDDFHRKFWGPWPVGPDLPEPPRLRWMGHICAKNPFDLWMYQEILYETQPDVIIETGTYTGGTALYLATLCEHLNRGMVVTIDINRLVGSPQHRRLVYLIGDSVGVEVTKCFENLAEQIARKITTCMVILDSDHSKTHVMNELRFYSNFVTPGKYLVVEDTNVNGHPIAPDFGPGPWEAVEEFLVTDDRFEIDHSRERLMFTYNPSGYLKRKS